jgi:hypothetical protein
MNFWEKKFGVKPAAPVQQPAGGPWWQYQPASEAVTELPSPEPVHDFSKALHLRKTDNCPQCGSTNYMTLGQVTSNSGRFDHKRCFECGYPAMQSMSGMASFSGKPGIPAKQVSLMNLTNDQGRILGVTEAASGISSTYNPTDARAGRIG